MKTEMKQIIINHINAGNLELHGICVNDLVKDIESSKTPTEMVREAFDPIQISPYEGRTVSNEAYLYLIDRKYFEFKKEEKK